MSDVFYESKEGKLLVGNSLDVLKNIEPSSVDSCITSPPYWALRDYHVDGQLGQEKSFTEYIDNLLDYFDLVYEVLKEDGSLWVNLGDTYYGSNKGSGGKGAKSKKQVTNKGSYFVENKGNHESNLENAKTFNNKELPRKSLCLIPSRFAIGMQERGWILRNDIIWRKPNSMVTSAKDRFTNDYEHLFFFTKSPKYKFNQQLEPYTLPMNRWGGTELKASGESPWDEETGQESYRQRNMRPNPKGRNKRAVWDINTQPEVGGIHFAKFPEKLIETPILASTNEGDIILDIFMGSGTTAVVAERLNRKWIGIELNELYCQSAVEKILKKRGLNDKS